MKKNQTLSEPIKKLHDWLYFSAEHNLKYALLSAVLLWLMFPNDVFLHHRTHMSSPRFMSPSSHWKLSMKSAELERGPMTR